MKDIRDTIHGEYIHITEEEVDVLDHPRVQRLRRVHQLGLSELVYPSASHTRLEHSLGVMYLAGEFAESLGLDEEKVKAYRMAGLLHDIGHSPFSHATEAIMERDLDISHESRSCKLIDEMSDTIPADAETVKQVIRGNSEYDIVAGDVDADRMDYLLRDSSRTGPEHGQVDATTIINFATAEDGEIVFEEPALQAVEDLFNARFGMNKSVYSHHTSKIAESMLERAVDAFLETSDYSTDEMVNWDDYQLHTYLLDFDGVANELYERVANRDLYKRALYLSDLNYTREGLERLADQIDDPRVEENRIAEKVGIETSDVIVDPPSPPSGLDINVTIRIAGEKRDLNEISPAIHEVEESEWRSTILGVYTPSQHTEDVRKAAKEVLDLDL